jgi:hypothetical protein
MPSEFAELIWKNKQGSMIGEPEIFFVTNHNVYENTKS